MTEWRRVESAREAEAAIIRGLPVLTDDPSVLTACDAIDIIVEVTGTVEAGRRASFSRRSLPASTSFW